MGGIGRKSLGPGPAQVRTSLLMESLRAHADLPMRLLNLKARPWEGIIWMAKSGQARVKRDGCLPINSLDCITEVSSS